MTFTGKLVLVFHSRTFSIHMAAEEGERYLFNSSLPFPPATQTLRHQPGDCCRELTSSHRQQSDSNREPYIYFCNTYIHIYCIIYILLKLLRKKENALIIHSAIETWKYAIIRKFIILSLCPFSKISHPFDSEPATLLNLQDQR